MNKKRSDIRNQKGFGRGALWIGILTVMIGCGRFVDHRYDTVSVKPEQLETIEAVDWQPLSLPEKTDDSKPESSVTTDPLVSMDASTRELALDINQCRALALEHNLDLQVQLYNPQIAETAVASARAVFEPLVFSDFTFYQTDTPTISDIESSNSRTDSWNMGFNMPLRTGGRITLNMPFSRRETDNRIQITEGETYTSGYTYYSNDLTVSLTQPLLRNAGWRTNTHGIRIANYNALSSRAQMKLETMSVLAMVDKVYWRLYAARQELLVRKQEYDLAIAQLERAKRMVAAQTRARIEVLRAESAAAERLEGIILSEKTVRDRERDLKRILNKPDLGMDSPVILVPTMEIHPTFIPLDPKLVVAYALEHRMELLELELQIATQSSTIDLERNRSLPVLALSYSYNINGLGDSGSEAFDMVLDNAYSDHRVGLSLEIPFGNKAAKSRLRQAVLRKRQGLATRERRAATITQEVLGGIDQLSATWQRVLASGKSEQLARETLEAEQRQFELGLQTSTEVLSAQTRYANARSSALRAQVEYQIAQIDLAYATGCLLEAAKVRWDNDFNQKQASQ